MPPLRALGLRSFVLVFVVLLFEVRILRARDEAFQVFREVHQLDVRPPDEGMPFRKGSGHQEGVDAVEVAVPTLRLVGAQLEQRLLGLQVAGENPRPSVRERLQSFRPVDQPHLRSGLERELVSEFGLVHVQRNEFARSQPPVRRAPSGRLPRRLQDPGVAFAGDFHVQGGQGDLLVAPIRESEDDPEMVAFGVQL